MQRNHRLVALLAAALASGACAELPTGPGPDTAAPMEEEGGGTAAGTSAVVAFDAALDASRDHAGAGLPTLDHAWQVALRAVAEEHGPAAAAAIQRRWNALLELARQAAEAGEEALARRYLHAARELQLETVLHAFGERVAVRLHAVVGLKLQALEERVEAAAGAGHDVARVRQLLAEAGALHRTAEEALRSGDPASAIDADFAAAELLNEAIGMPG